jgi:integrase
VTKHENFVPKDRSNRTIPITKRFAEFLRTYLAGRQSDEYVLAPEKNTKGAIKYRYAPSECDTNLIWFSGSAQGILFLN